MSAGHKHSSGGFGIDTVHLERVLKNVAVQEALARPFTVDRTFDIPFIAGYNRDASKVFIDRHMPRLIKLYLDGRYIEIDPTRTLIEHEHTEKSLIDALGYDYERAHKVATAAERRLFLKLFGPSLWSVYQAKFDQYAKNDEHEKLVRVPQDLDLTPYTAPPVDRSLLAHLEKFVHPEKHTKEEAEYASDKGKPNHHCGPDKYWRSNYCEYWREPNRCSKVSGYIAARGGCKYFERKEK